MLGSRPFFIRGNQVSEEARKPGRPPGSLNKRSLGLAKVIAARHGCTAGEALAALALPTVEELVEAGGLRQAMKLRVDAMARELQCPRVEAFREVRHALAELMPYLHQKQPIALQVEQTASIGLVIDAGALAQGGGAGGGPVLDLAPRDVRESAAISEACAPVAPAVTSQPSHEAVK
jgi:hypothetical protein